MLKTDYYRRDFLSILEVSWVSVSGCDHFECWKKLWCDDCRCNLFWPVMRPCRVSTVVSNNESICRSTTTVRCVHAKRAIEVSVWHTPFLLSVAACAHRNLWSSFLEQPTSYGSRQICRGILQVVSPATLKCSRLKYLTNPGLVSQRTQETLRSSSPDESGWGWPIRATPTATDQASQMWKPTAIITHVTSTACWSSSTQPNCISHRASYSWFWKQYASTCVSCGLGKPWGRPRGCLPTLSNASSWYSR